MTAVIPHIRPFQSRGNIVDNIALGIADGIGENNIFAARADRINLDAEREDQGRYPGLQVGSITAPNNNAGNWE